MVKFKVLELTLPLTILLNDILGQDEDRVPLVILQLSLIT